MASQYGVFSFTVISIQPQIHAWSRGPSQFMELPGRRSVDPVQACGYGDISVVRDSVKVKEYYWR